MARWVRLLTYCVSPRAPTKPTPAVPGMRSSSTAPRMPGGAMPVSRSSGHSRLLRTVRGEGWRGAELAEQAAHSPGARTQADGRQRRQGFRAGWQRRGSRLRQRAVQPGVGCVPGGAAVPANSHRIACLRVWSAHWPGNPACRLPSSSSRFCSPAERQRPLRLQAGLPRVGVVVPRLPGSIAGVVAHLDKWNPTCSWKTAARG
jgi:hypothetical protein